MEKLYKVKKKETYIPSSNGKDRLHVVVWEPQGKIKAVLQISHGMIELIERYDRFANYLAERGILVAGNDHLGHGLTAANRDELGYMNAYDGSKAIVCDLHRVTICLKKAYKGVPFFLMGHSMGSFMARRYMSDFGFDKKRPSKFTPHSSIDGFICMGSGSIPEPLLRVGKLVVAVEKKHRGDRYRSPLVNVMAFGTYNLGIPKETKKDGVVRSRTTKDWLTRDTDMVDAYLNNPFCQFSFTVKGYETLFQTLSYIQKPENIAKIPKNIPVLFVAGDMDPVGHYGKDVRKLYKLYAEYISNDVNCYLYNGARHEILNELEYQKTQKDIYEWMIGRVELLK